MLSKARLCTLGWPRAITVQPDTRAIKRHRSRCDVRNSMHAKVNRKRKIADERGSFEKLVGGVTAASIASWAVEKSSIRFCKSLMFRKKSLDNSEVGLVVRGGASGGPAMEY